MSDALETIVAFLREVGVSVVEGAVAEASLLPGVYINNGAIVFDRSKLQWPGDLLHEAGHVAVTPGSQRPSLNGLVEADSAPYAGEVEATAWAYAALVHLRLPASVLFHEGGYQGKSAGLIAMFGVGVYPGAFGLAQAGMARVGADVPASAAYPKMTQWLRG